MCKSVCVLVVYEFGEFDMRKGSLIAISLKSIFVSFQCVYFNGNHVFPLLIINYYKKQLLSIELLYKMRQEHC